MYDFESWMKDNKNLVYHLIRKVDSKLVTDEDLYQEICISIWKSLESFDDTKGVCLNTYVSKSITNAIYYYLRKHHIDKDPYNHSIESIYKEISLEDNSIQLVDTIKSNNNILFIDFDYLKSHVDENHISIVVDFMGGANQKLLTRKYNLSQPQISRILSKYTNIIKESIISG